MTAALGPYAGFILISYGLVACVVLALIAGVAVDYRRQQEKLRELESRGATRRSATRGERQ
jgi:heme exporter protein D